MKAIKQSLFVLLLMPLATTLTAQDFPFSFSVLQEDYADLPDPVSLDGGVTWDDPTVPFPIGFTFDLFGYRMDTLFLSGILLGGNLTNFPDELAVGTVFGNFEDLIDRGYELNMNLSDLGYQLTGTAGNRILKIEWKNVGFYEEVAEDGTADNFINFQIWLYEGSNDLEFRFGPNDVPDPELVYLLSTGPLLGFVEFFDDELEIYNNFWYLFGDPAAPQIGLLADASEPPPNGALTGTPADGTVYRFSPVTTSARDLPISQTKLEIWPNPTSGQINFTLPEADDPSESFQVNVTDMHGKLVLEKTISAGDTPGLQVGQLTAGTYVLRLQKNGHTFALEKFVKN